MTYHQYTQDKEHRKERFGLVYSRRKGKILKIEHVQKSSREGLDGDSLDVENLPIALKKGV